EEAARAGSPHRRSSEAAAVPADAGRTASHGYLRGHQWLPRPDRRESAEGLGARLPRVRREAVPAGAAEDSRREDSLQGDRGGSEASNRSFQPAVQPGEALTHGKGP